MSFVRGRELLDPSPEPPVRLLTRPSVPFNGPEVPTVQDGSLGAYVDAKSPATSEVLPTSPGKTRSQLPGASHLEDYSPPQAGGRAVPLHLGRNVGHDMSHVRQIETGHEVFQDRKMQTRHDMSCVDRMQMGSEMFHISEVKTSSMGNDDTVFPTQFDRTVMNERYSLATGVPHQLLYVDDRENKKCSTGRECPCQM